ncbi:MAG: ribulose-phosphate 3-epimerase [Candidatus Limnocylindrales bacterium]
MNGGRARLAAGILEADFGNLYRVVRKLERAGADRLHLDVMDGHLVPRLTFGPDVVRGIRRLTRLPLDVHLSVDRPSALVEPLISAGADSITLQLEAPETADRLRGALVQIRRAGLAAGLAVNPATPVSALAPFRELIDIALVLMVDPATPERRFRRELAGKVADARELFEGRPHGWEVHVAGGVDRATADLLGGYGADLLVVGSALFERGHDVAREIRLVKALADEGWTREIGRGEPPIPRESWSVVATLAHAEADALSRVIERAGIPTLVLRTGAFVPGVDAQRVVMVPASAEVFARKRFGLGFAEEDETL